MENNFGFSEAVSRTMDYMRATAFQPKDFDRALAVRCAKYVLLGQPASIYEPVADAALQILNREAINATFTGAAEVL